MQANLRQKDKATLYTWWSRGTPLFTWVSQHRQKAGATWIQPSRSTWSSWRGFRSAEAEIFLMLGELTPVLWPCDVKALMLTHWKRPWCWERLRAGREEGNRRWDSWMVSPTRWTWVWASSRSQWRIGKPGVLQPIRSQRVRCNLATEQHLALKAVALWTWRAGGHVQTGHKGAVVGSDWTQLSYYKRFSPPRSPWFNLGFLPCETVFSLPRRHAVRSK